MRPPLSAGWPRRSSACDRYAAMHEIGIVRSMCKTVLDYAKANNVQRISEIVCEVGLCQDDDGGSAGLIGESQAALDTAEVEIAV